MAAATKPSWLPEPPLRRRLCETTTCAAFCGGGGTGEAAVRRILVVVAFPVGCGRGRRRRRRRKEIHLRQPPPPPVATAASGDVPCGRVRRQGPTGAAHVGAPARRCAWREGLQGQPVGGAGRSRHRWRSPDVRPVACGCVTLGAGRAARARLKPVKGRDTVRSPAAGVPVGAALPSPVGASLSSSPSPTMSTPQLPPSLGRRATTPAQTAGANRPPSAHGRPDAIPSP